MIPSDDTDGGAVRHHWMLIAYYDINIKYSYSHGGGNFLKVGVVPPEGATTEWTVIAPADEAYYSFNRSREDERLSWPCWLTYSGRFTRINGYPAISCRSGADKWKFAGQRPTFYHWATQPTVCYIDVANDDWHRRLRACVRSKERHFRHSLWTDDINVVNLCHFLCNFCLTITVLHLSFKTRACNVDIYTRVCFTR